MYRPVLAGFVVVLLAVGLGAGALLIAGEPVDTQVSGSTATFVPGTSTSDATVQNADQNEPDEFDSTTFDVTVYENGTATWTFKYKRVLTSDDEVEQFETYAERFETEETDQYQRFQEQASALTASGEDYTSREMEATDFERSATVEEGLNDQGVVEMSFTWTNFARVHDDGTVVVSDVFSGTLPIMEDQRLTIRAADGLTIAEANPQSGATHVETANAVHWDGPLEFIDGHPYVVFVPADGSGGGDGSNTLADRATSLAGVLVVALAALVAFAWYRYGPRPSGGDPVVGESTPRADSANGQADDPISDEELMTDEDRVVDLIRRNGGRMKQVNIVEETGWSKSKVSMLLSDMEDEGTISKLRVGRENIISLDGFEPEATKSPFDE